MKFHKLLIPIAPNQTISDRIHELLAIADRESSEVVFLTVIDDLGERANLTSARWKRADLVDIADQLQQQHLQSIIAECETEFPNVKFAAKVVFGRPFVHIIRMSKDLQSDLIVVDANRGHKRRATHFGSNTRHLMRKSEVPVWTLAEKQVQACGRLVMAVDVEAGSPDNMLLNDKIIDFGCSLAELCGLKPVLLHAWTLYGEGYLQSWAKSRAADVEEYAKAEEEQRKRLCEKLASGKDVEITILKGRPDDVIPEFVIEEGADILVMGTLSRAGLAGVIIGNTAESVIDALDCSILTLKPDSFKSPVVG